MSKGLILVVDDEPEIVKSISMRLTARGYRTLAAMDGLQAVNIAIAELPDAIILDIGLPAGDGHTVVKRLRNSSRTCTIPILFLTARTAESDHKQAFEEGVDKYITKPFDAECLIAALEEVLSSSISE